MISNKIRQDEHVDEFHKEFLIKKTGKKYRVYKDATEYSSTSGQNIKKGKVMRACSGKPVSFNSIEESIKWIDDGCKLTDNRGNELFD